MTYSHLVWIEPTSDAHGEALCQISNLAELHPIPTSLATTHLPDTLGFMLSMGAIQEAKQIMHETGEPWPFESENPSLMEIGRYLAENPHLREQAAACNRLLTQYGHACVSDWVRANWGGYFEEHRLSIEFEQGLCSFEWSDSVSRIPLLWNLGTRPDVLQLKAIVVQKTQLPYEITELVMIPKKGIRDIKKQTFDQLDALEEAYQGYSIV